MSSQRLMSSPASPALSTCRRSAKISRGNNRPPPPLDFRSPAQRLSDGDAHKRTRTRARPQQSPDPALKLVRGDPTKLSYKDSIADRTAAFPGSTYSFNAYGPPDNDLNF